MLDMLENESWEPRPGSALVTERLLEILLVEVIRNQGDAQAHARKGLIAGLADPQIAACLDALHQAPSRGWSVATLARAAGLSRSAFAIQMPPRALGYFFCPPGTTFITKPADCSADS